jgi:hypothetical protein
MEAYTSEAEIAAGLNVVFTEEANTLIKLITLLTICFYEPNLSTNPAEHALPYLFFFCILPS